MPVERGFESLRIPDFQQNVFVLSARFSTRTASLPPECWSFRAASISSNSCISKNSSPGVKITWLIEETSHHEPTLRAHLEKSGSGAMFSAVDTAPASAGSQLQPYLENAGVLIYVPGRAAVRNATPCHIPSAHLRTLCAFGLPVLPVAIDCPRESSLSVERRSSLPASVFAIGKPIPAAKSTVAAYQQALLEAADEAYSSRSLFKGSLADGPA